MMMMSFLYHSIFLLYFFYLYHSVSSSSLCLSSVYHVCLRDKTLISTLYLHTISLAPWSFIHDGVVVSGRWHDFSLSAHSHFPSFFLDNSNLYIFCSLPSQSLSSLPCQSFSLPTQRDVAIQQTVHHFSLSPKCTCPPPFSSFLFHFFSFSLPRLSIRLDSTPTSCHRNEQPTLFTYTPLFCSLSSFSLSLWGERVSHSQTSLFQPYTTDTDKYIFIWNEIQTYTDSSSLLYSLFLSSLILTLS